MARWALALTALTPKRIQRRRTKGWRMPADCVSVARPGRWGNPYRVGIDGTAEECVALHRADVEAEIIEDPSYLDGLRGQSVACFCALDAPCHGDTYLELANP